MKKREYKVTRKEGIPEFFFIKDEGRGGSVDYIRKVTRTRKGFPFVLVN